MKKGYGFLVTVSYEEMFEKAKGFFREQRVSLCRVSWCHVIHKNTPEFLRKYCCICYSGGEGEGDGGEGGGGTTPIVPIALIDNM